MKYYFCYFTFFIFFRTLEINTILHILHFLYKGFIIRNFVYLLFLEHIFLLLKQNIFNNLN